MKIGINGFGRIGRCILRAAFERNLDIDFKINAGFGDIEQNAYLLKYDSTHGVFEDVKVIDENTISVNNRNIKMVFETKLENLSWDGMDVVMECTGVFTDREKAALHLNAGAKKVIISGPSTNADKTIVIGVNEQTLTQSDKVISIGSCTTNCLAPVAYLLNNTIGIEHGFMTTIHSYTNDQVVLDTLHKDLRRGRTSAASIIPSSTGAAKALSLVIPELKGKLDGTALRVPTKNVSLIDFKFVAPKNTSADEINSIMRANTNDILKVCEEELVSIDFNHDTHSSIFDITQTKVVGNRFCRVVAWYDNEWGFSNRMLDAAAIINKL